MFSGFYLALFLLLVGLIMRGISFEYRSKDPNPKWRNRFDWMIAIGSFLAALLLGAAFANLARGVPINENMMFTGNLFTLLNPYGLLGGVTTVAIFLLHGANFLGLKLEGKLRERVNATAKKLWIVATVLYIALGVFTYIAGFWGRGYIDPGIVPITAVVVLLVAGYFINQKREGWAFIMVALNIVLTQVTFFSMTFPNVMLSSTNPACQPDDLQRLVLAVHADGDEHRGADLRPDRAGLSGLDLLHVPQTHLQRERNAGLLKFQVERSVEG